MGLVGPIAGAHHEGKESPREKTVKVFFRAYLIIRSVIFSIDS
jgi:hypothetical protein